MSQKKEGFTAYQRQLLENMTNNPYASVIPADTTSDAVRRVLHDDNGRLRCLPAAEITALNPAELRLFCQEESYYQLPTTELIAFLRNLIAGRTVLEIGAGRGHIGRHLGCRMTDSYMQAEHQYRKLYEAQGVPVIRYPRDVERLNAKQAMKRYKPEVVVACWVTHEYSASRPEMEGSVLGIDTQWIIDRCKTFIFVGHPRIHDRWTLPNCNYELYQNFETPTVVSRTDANGMVLVMQRSQFTPGMHGKLTASTTAANGSSLTAIITKTPNGVTKTGK